MHWLAGEPKQCPAQFKGFLKDMQHRELHFPRPRCTRIACLKDETDIGSLLSSVVSAALDRHGSHSGDIRRRRRLPILRGRLEYTDRRPAGNVGSRIGRVHRRRLCWTLLGICGSEADIEIVEELIARRRVDPDFDLGLDAALGCYLTLGGERALATVERDQFGGFFIETTNCPGERIAFDPGSRSVRRKDFDTTDG